MKEVTAKEAAEILGVTRGRISQLQADGRLTVIRVGRDRTNRYNKNEINQLAKDYRHRPATPKQKLDSALQKLRRSLKPLSEAGYEPAMKILEKLG